MDETVKPIKKQLMAAALTYDTMPSGGQLVLKYRVDGGSWVVVFIANEAGAEITEAFRAILGQFSSGREYEYAIESTGGAAPTGLYANYLPLASIL